MTEIMPGLRREMLEDDRIVVWTFAPPGITDPGVMSIPADYFQNTLRPMAQAWMKATRETLTTWPADKPYLAVHELPTLAQLVGATSLGKLVGLDIRSIWVDRATDDELPSPIWWRLAVILDPVLSARFNWATLPQPATRNIFKPFFAEDEEMRVQARADAVTWLLKD